MKRIYLNYKIIISVCFVLLVGSTAYIYFKSNNQGQEYSVPPVDRPKIAQAQVDTPKVLGQQKIVEAKYVINIEAVDKNIDGKYVAIKVRVTNVTQGSLDYSPNIQFKYAGLSSNLLNSPTPLLGQTIFAGGPINSGDASVGTLYFEQFSNETAELRFYADAVSSQYIVVPLIASPSPN